MTRSGSHSEHRKQLYGTGGHQFGAGCLASATTRNSPAPSGHQSVPLAALPPRVAARTEVCGFGRSSPAEQRTACCEPGWGSWSEVLGRGPGTSAEVEICELKKFTHYPSFHCLSEFFNKAMRFIPRK